VSRDTNPRLEIGKHEIVFHVRHHGPDGTFNIQVNEA
jgi:hypothetical protein